STDILKLLPEPKDLEISYEQGSIYVSCTAESNSNIEYYWLCINIVGSKEQEEKTIKFDGSLKIIEKFSNDLINSSDGAKIEICASAKAIGHDLILDSKIKTSAPYSNLVQYAAPQNVKHTNNSNSIIVSLKAPNNGRYEIQIMSVDNEYCCDEKLMTSIQSVKTSVGFGSWVKDFSANVSRP
ncbi:13333_t:CDS:2, partial [Ambispora leptoticha]